MVFITFDNIEFKADTTDNDFELNYDTVIESDDNENGNDNDRNNERVHLVPRRGTNREVNRPNQVARNAREQDRIGQVANSRPRTAAAPINEPRDVRIAQNTRMTRSQGQAPEIPNVLPSQIERSKTLQNKFKELHKLN